MTTSATRQPLDPVYGRLFTVQTEEGYTLHFVRIYDELNQSSYIMGFDPIAHHSCCVGATINKKHIPWDIL